MSTVFALTAILCAAGLDLLEHFLAAHEASQWLLVGIRYLSIFLFCMDAIVIGVVVTKTAVRLMAK